MSTAARPAHSEDAVNHQIQFFVARGFNVLDPNYRGSTGFGLAFREAIKEDGWGGREQDDIRTGIEALIAAGHRRSRARSASPAPPMAATRPGAPSPAARPSWSPPPRPICGMTDLVVDYETTRPDLRPYSEEMLGGRPDQVPERYRERSPIHFVRQHPRPAADRPGPAATPTSRRRTCAPCARRWTQAGVPYEVLAFEDEGHGIMRPKNQKTLYLRLADFFGQAFAGPAPAR